MATRKMNPFMKFMGKFRKANKGKYDFKQMGREAGKAWRKVKGGGPKEMCEANWGSGTEEEKMCLENNKGGRNRQTQKRRRR